MSTELQRPLEAGGDRWGTGPWMFFLCIIGGALVGVLSFVYLMIEASGSFWSLDDGLQLVFALGIATVLGVIVGVPVGIVVMVSSTVSRRLNGRRSPGIIAGVIGSCTVLWLLAGAASDLLLFFVMVVVFATSALLLAAHAIDSRELRFSEARLRSDHDVDSSETP